MCDGVCVHVVFGSIYEKDTLKASSLF